MLMIVMLLTGMAYWYFGRSKNNNTSLVNGAAYNPIINPGDFVATVNNPYFNLTPGTTYSYQTITSDGTEKIEVTVTDEKRIVLGVTTTVIRDQVWMNDVVVEDTRDYYAQDSSGTVWYFGEAVDNYENGRLQDHAGSWEAGVDGAKPGIIMAAAPKVGDSYRQEYYRGQAEDMADVVAVGKSITVPFGTYENCLQTYDWSQIETTLKEYKYYCPKLGFLALETSTDGTEKTELVQVVP